MLRLEGLGCAQLHRGGFLSMEVGDMLPGLVTPPRTMDDVALHPQTQFVKPEPVQPPSAIHSSALPVAEVALGDRADLCCLDEFYLLHQKK